MTDANNRGRTLAIIAVVAFIIIATSRHRQRLENLKGTWLRLSVRAQ